MSDETSSVKPAIAVPADARDLHAHISSQLKELLYSGAASCLEELFRQRLSKVHLLLDNYQKKIVAEYSRKVECSKGCSWCCNHWVEDVNSFEAEIIADFIRKKMPSSIEKIKKICEQDIAVLEYLDHLVNKKMVEEDIDDEEDSTVLLLSAFYRMNRPCPLLGTDGTCSIYDVRPLTCRVYMSFSSPDNCHPDNINRDDIPTYIMDLEEDANAVVDQLHFKYQKFNDDTGLRSLLLKYLQR